MKVKRLAGPSHNIGWTQDFREEKARVHVSLVEERHLLALESLIEAQEKLMACYRLQTRRGVDGALDAIHAAKEELIK